ncbi:MAG: isoleucyl-tRNA synthetase, partial [Clostridia bacterium]|nr:isoleucyl-tRNA synthetase [Clostridia bacterium]
MDRESPIILGEHVTLETGTGCVHTAPGHGMEDYQVSLKYNNVPIIVPVDDKGYMTEEAGKFKGLYYEKSNTIILEELKALNALLAVQKVVHQYPHCWRCKNPVIFRATEQWFCSIDKFREQAIEACKQVKWVPEWGMDRMIGMIRDRNDWCISRQRIWGVPIPILYCKQCNKPIINDTTIKIISDLFRIKGSDSWYELSAAEILKGAITCECGCNEFEKEKDIMDVWFDSGSSSSSVLDQRGELQFPADTYLEGIDQYRGWFQSSLLISVAVKGVPPYKNVYSHGFTVDGEGKKMSKSIGNTISPNDVVKDYGADILRLWVSSSEYTSDVRISNDMLKQLSEIYRKIRNTARFILGNITDFNPNSDMVEFDKMSSIDRWSLIRLNNLINRVTKSFDS